MRCGVQERLSNHFGSWVVGTYVAVPPHNIYAIILRPSMRGTQFFYTCIEYRAKNILLSNLCCRMTIWNFYNIV